MTTAIIILTAIIGFIAYLAVTTRDKPRGMK